LSFARRTLKQWLGRYFFGWGFFLPFGFLLLLLGFWYFSADIGEGGGGDSADVFDGGSELAGVLACFVQRLSTRLNHSSAARFKSAKDRIKKHWTEIHIKAFLPAVIQGDL
jgi:hypothetical protein